MGLSVLRLIVCFLLLPAFVPANTMVALSYHNGIRPHPFFVSVTEFNHNPKENLLEISCKLFADDLESTLKAQYKTPVDLTHPADTKQVEGIMSDYLQKHLRLKVNGKAVSIVFVGFEKEKEAVWCYLQVSNIPAMKALEVKNDLLYETYNTQIGIMHATSGGVRKSTRVTNPEATASFEW